MKNLRIIGYDLNREYAQISYWDQGMEEPETLYLMDEKDGTELPLVIAKTRDSGVWVSGTEARRMEIVRNGIVVRDLLDKCMQKTNVRVGSESIPPVVLLTEFIRQSLQRLYVPETKEQDICLVFTLPKVNEDMITMLKSIAVRLGVRKDAVFVQDYHESFYDYVWPQPREIWNYDVTLFGYQNDVMYAYKMQKTPLPKGRKKELISISYSSREDIHPDKTNDAAFESFARSFFGRNLISSVFLIGSEFEDDWYSGTLQYICNGRRVFQGKNLYSKGACYGGMRKIGIVRPNTVYMDDYKIASQIGIRVRNRGKDQWFPLVYQGENWYEVDRSIEVLVDQATQLHIQIDNLGSSIPREEVIPLEGLFDRQRRTTRLRLEAVFLSKNMCKLMIKDVNFGEIMKASGYTLEHTLQLENVSL